MKTKLLSLLCAVLLVFSTGCEAERQAEPESSALRVLATTYPVYLFTTAVTEGASGVEVSLLVNQETSCLHDYTLTVNDMKAIEQADVIVMNGAGFESFMDDALSHSEVARIDASEAIALLTAPGHDHDFDESGDDEDHFDPHIWLSPANATQMLDTIATRLSQLDDTNATLYQSNAAAAEQRLEQEILSLPNTLTCRELITFHDGFAYFAQAMDLTLLKAIEEEEGSEASAADIKEIVALVREYQIPTIFTEKNGSDSTALAIARETGCAVAQLDMMMSGAGRGIDPYLETMNANIQTISEAFQ